MSTRQKGLFKPVPRRNDMDSSMYREIEKIAKDCVESTKERLVVWISGLLVLFMFPYLMKYSVHINWILNIIKKILKFSFSFNFHI